MRARVVALRQAASSDPSCERMCSEMEMVECGKRWVSKVWEKVLLIVVCISVMRLFEGEILACASGSGIV